MNGRVRLLVATVAALLAAGVLAAVVVRGGGEGDGGEAGATRPATAPEGSLRVGVPGLPVVYDPFDVRSRTVAARQVLGAVLPQLFDVRPDGSVEGRLVEHADGDGVVTEGSEVRFRLAEGARWSDGTPITAADLAFTLDVVRSDVWPGPRTDYERVESITGEGRDVTVRFVGEPFVGWERLFSGDDYVLPRHRLTGEDLEHVWDAGPDLSGGPYLFEGFTPGLDVVLAANPEWWGDGPGVRDLRLLTVPDVTTLEQLFEREELDVAWVSAYTERTRVAGEQLDGDPDVSVSEPGGHLVELVMNTDTVPEATRVAALDFVDRDRFVDVLMEGEADLATSWGRLDRSPGWPQWFVEVASAEGIDDTLTFATPEEEPMAPLLTRSVQRRGRATDLRFDSVRLGTELLDSEWLPEGRFDMALVDEVQWPSPCWACRWGSDAVGESNWSRTGAYDDLVTDIYRGDLAAASRLERRLEQEGVVLPLWRPRAVVASRGVEGIEANAWWPGPLYRVERWRLSG